MNGHYELLYHQVRQTGVKEAEWRPFEQGTRLLQAAPGERIIEAGQQVRNAYFCTTGLFRLYYTLADGREYNVVFTVAPDFATAYAAVITGEPAAYSIESMEHSTVIEIPSLVLQSLMDCCRGWERYVRRSLERLYIRKEERERELLYLTAKERYDVFHLKYPGLAARIPQYHIASYLGISPVSLSRLLRQEGH
ncbi:Crp/Fnr family transcriptional regulator [Paenibacillus sp. JX-17]|uniref:Crp/Fnr family transcriptional regulator n=1 Tax=Paenibacillus lacisoli TaxID=3064525 RepID=A0ABT9CAL0_9BACL|nr:Crp/Fnr family transcriptional regulator [Paenibacillus sp. JX-17]MDO7906289.1 Crp/Fnr family transcriptional regulator [Paenibacillus sp. JX-17]